MPREFLICKVILFSSLALILLGLVCESSPATNEPLYIGVLLPLTGPEGESFLDGLQLALDQINGGGGIGGRPVELILRDTNSGDLMTYAEDLVQDPRIQVVVGPLSSDNIFTLSELFSIHDKILISPTATSDEVYRAFSGTGTVWRTITNDEEIISVVMQHLSTNNAKSVAILTANNSYGRTFYDWIPFWAIETGISITGSEEYSDTDEIQAAVRRLCIKNPDYLIFVNPTISGRDIPLAIETLGELNSSTHLYLFYPNIDDNGYILETPSSGALQRLLISGIWTLRNRSINATRLPDGTLIMMSKPWDQDFAADFKTVSNISKADYVTETYDSLLAAAEVMARFTAFPKKSPMNAAMTVLSKGSGTPIPRTKDGFQRGFDLIQKGEVPIFSGANGPLTFRPEGTDRLTTQYGIYHIEGGEVIPDTIAYQRLTKSDEKSNLPGNASGTSVINQTLSPGDFWAVIGAFSHDWENYRHQADALTVYEFLKGRGVPDDHIILLVYDDIPEDQKNKKPGEVYHTPGEEEVRKRANPDYIGDKVNKQMLWKILTGIGGDQEDSLLQSGTNSTVLLYLSSHGAPGGNLIFGNRKEIVTPDEFSSIIEEMAKEQKFGRMLVVLESCFSEATASQVHTPGVAVISASASDETSKSATYDTELGAWLSDEFTSQLITVLRTADPSLSLRNFYRQVYHNVRSSHPRISYNSSVLDDPVLSFFGGYR